MHQKTEYIWNFILLFEYEVLKHLIDDTIMKRRPPYHKDCRINFMQDQEFISHIYLLYWTHRQLLAPEWTLVSNWFNLYWITNIIIRITVSMSLAFTLCILHTRCIISYMPYSSFNDFHIMNDMPYIQCTVKCQEIIAKYKHEQTNNKLGRYACPGYINCN